MDKNLRDRITKHVMNHSRNIIEKVMEMTEVESNTKIGRILPADLGKMFNITLNYVSDEYDSSTCAYTVSYLFSYNINSSLIDKMDDVHKKAYQNTSLINVEVKSENKGANKIVRSRITSLNGKEFIIDFPEVNMLDEQKTKEEVDLLENLRVFNITEAGEKTLNEFLIFKYHQQEATPKHSEVNETYYNLLLFGDDSSTMNEFVHTLAETMGLDQSEIFTYSEDEIYENKGKIDLDSVYRDRNEISDEDARLIYIKDCNEKPYVNEDAGTGGLREQSAQKAEKYIYFWNSVAEFTKENPTVTIVVTMKEYVYKNTFKADNELNHRIFGHRLYVPPVSIERVIETCKSSFRSSSFKLSNDFLDELEKYIRTIYARADLKGIPFATDVVNRVYSYYFRKKKGNGTLTPAYIPYYMAGIRSVDDVIAQLDGLVGLEEVKKEFSTIYKSRLSKTTKRKSESHHMLFLGNPGTGKTTVAQLTADLLCEAGVIKTNKLVEATIGDMVSAYRDNSAQKTKAKINEAIDGVLFIDEAYGLDNHSEGSEASINILIQEMEKHKEDLVVIFAGYEDKLEDMLKSNPGISSRIAHTFHFKDFDVPQLHKIFDLKCREIGFTLDSAAIPNLEACLSARKLQEHFGNGRDVENLVNELYGIWSNENYELAKKSNDHQTNLPKVFCEKHFVDLMPPKNEPTIEEMIGLGAVKEKLKKYTNKVKYANVLKRKGMDKVPEAYMHMVFLGNPGTGKTTVAKMIANDLYSLGVLKTNRLEIVEIKDIIGHSVGDSARLVNDRVRKAKGGVFFVDEAYSLVNAGTSGQEVIETLITAMVDHREDTIFIFAGYPQEMGEFLGLNPGIPSRIGDTFIFEDYNTDELMQIFDQQMDESGFLVSMEAREKVEEIMEYFRSLPRFGNGRFVEKVISQIILNRSEREYTDMDYNRIEKEDVPEIGKLIETNSTGIRFQDPNHITQEDRLRTAYHELGHAIAIYELPTNIIMEKISIKSQALSLGRVSLNRYPRNRTEEEMKNEIVVALAGRTAERTILGGCDEGCASDYASAKMTADEMINKYGMCDIGVTTEKDLIREGDEVATKLIKKYQKFIKSVAKDLVAGKEFTGEEFAAMVERFENKKKNKYSVDTEN